MDQKVKTGLIAGGIIGLLTACAISALMVTAQTRVVHPVISGSGQKSKAEAKKFLTNISPDTIPISKKSGMPKRISRQPVPEVGRPGDASLNPENRDQ